LLKRLRGIESPSQPGFLPMTRIRRKRIALIAAVALLFSALSPAIAGALFSHRADILVRVLGMPAQHHAAAQATSGHGDVCLQSAATATHHGTANAQTDDASDHAAHGTFCSFCLAASSLVSVPGAPTAHAMSQVGGAVFIPAGVVQPPAANLRLTRHPRDPPPALVLS
jgi:cation transporter-like permease